MGRHEQNEKSITISWRSTKFVGMTCFSARALCFSVQVSQFLLLTRLRVGLLLAQGTVIITALVTNGDHDDDNVEAITRRTAGGIKFQCSEQSYYTDVNIGIFNLMTWTYCFFTRPKTLSLISMLEHWIHVGWPSSEGTQRRLFIIESGTYP
jgi:hypothetical protein